MSEAPGRGHQVGAPGGGLQEGAPGWEHLPHWEASSTRHHVVTGQPPSSMGSGLHSHPAFSKSLDNRLSCLS